MIIVLKQHAPADKVEAFCKELNGMGYQINDSVGSDTHILGLIGDTKALAGKLGAGQPGRRDLPPRVRAVQKGQPANSTRMTPWSMSAVTRSAAATFAVMSGPLQR